MKHPNEPTYFERWFANEVMLNNSLEKLNRRQWRIVEKVRRYNKWLKIQKQKEVRNVRRTF